MKAAAIYARVSTTGQAKDGTSLNTQTEACGQYAEEHGYTVLHVQSEDFTGSRLDRPGLDVIRNLAERGEIEAVICYDPDRLSRKVGHFALLQDELERRQVSLEFVNAPAENTAEGQLMLMIRSSFAEYERAKIMERTRRGKERRAREGKIINHNYVPYGYAYNKEGASYEVYEPEAYWVRKMFSWLVTDGMSLRAITHRLTAEGAPTKTGAKIWSAATLLGILNSSTYCGEWYYNKRRACVPHNRRQPVGKRLKTSRMLRPKDEWIAVGIPAIIDKVTFEAVSAQLERNKAMSKRNSKNQYLLRGMLFCKQCGYRLTARSRTRARRTTIESFYQCPGREIGRAAPDCAHSWIHAGRVENLVWAEVVSQLSDPALITSTLEGRGDSATEARRKIDTELTALYEAQAGLKRENDKILELYRRDLLDMGTLEEQLADIKKRQNGIKAAILEARSRADDVEEAHANLETLERLIDLARSGLPHLTWEQKREFLEAIDFKGVVDGKQVELGGLITERVLDLNLHSSAIQDAIEKDTTLCLSSG